MLPIVPNYMYIVIFTPKSSRAKELGDEILDKLSCIGTCNVRHNGRTFEFPSKKIVIDIRDADLLRTGGLRARYYLIDDGCDYEFCENIGYSLLRRGDEQLCNMRHLIMKICEFALYGDCD